MAASAQRELIAGQIYQLVEFAEDSLSGLHFNGCQFIQCKFGGNNIDVVFEQCKFEGCNFKSSSFEGSFFLGCNLDGMDFSKSNLDETSFVECTLSDARFIGCSLFGSTFSRCDTDRCAILDSDAQFFALDDCFAESMQFDDTDLHDADLSTAWGLEKSQIESANGNGRTRLPADVDYPEHWDLEPPQIDVDEDEDAIPGQRPAPLRVLWREQRLVPDPRGTAKDHLRQASILAIFRALDHDIREFLATPTTNHPIVARVGYLQLSLARGLSGTNPVEVGYHVEILRTQLEVAAGELGDATLASVRGIVAGGSLFVAQFDEWKEIAANADAADRGDANLEQVSAAMRSLAASIDKTRDLFDRRIGESLEIQAEDLRTARENERIKQGATNSAGNVLSALSSRLWKIARGGAKTASEETLKVEIHEFLTENKGALATLVKWAPKSLAWFQDFWDSLI